MKSHLFFCFAALLAAATAHGRLGESPQALSQRYGPPLSTATLPTPQGSGRLKPITRCQYQKLGFLIDVYYQGGQSILELFATRGLSQDEARKVVIQVATHPVGCPSPAQEDQIRQAAGITLKDEVFWIWTSPTLPINAAYNPVECTLAFFSEPAIYARIQQALSSAPIASF
jgi:hypothetical protein